MGSQVSIRMANSSEELEGVFEFRYRIYVEEMGRKQTYADSAARRIVDPLDLGADNFFAWSNGRVVGTVRTNLCQKSSVGDYETLYSIPAYSGSRHPMETAVITRLMVAPELRGTSLGIRLAATCFSWSLRNGITRGFIDCNGHLIGFFRGLGFRMHCAPVLHNDYGEVQPMVIHLDEPSLLQRYCAREDSLVGGMPRSQGQHIPISESYLQ